MLIYQRAISGISIQFTDICILVELSESLYPKTFAKQHGSIHKNVKTEDSETSRTDY